MLGLAINAVAGVINAAWATLLIRIGTSHRSPALKADLAKIGETMLKEWLDKAGPDGQMMLDAYRK